MFSEDHGPAETAISFTDQFFDAAVTKLDALFGKGYAAQNPQALAAYVAACSDNLNAFMTAASAAMDDAAFDEAIAAFEDTTEPEPAPPPRGRRR